MNNKEKHEYIDCLSLVDQNCFINEIQKRNQVLSKSPNVLYKYRSFDKYTFEMIKEGYAYLSPVKDLDDPFDCVSNFDLKGIYNPKQDLITSKFINYIIETSNLNLSEENKIALIESLNNCLEPGGFDIEKTSLEFIKLGVPNNQAFQLATLLVNSVNYLDACDRAESFKDFAQVAYDPGNTIGVCSLSEIRDNKVMWSLYGKKYQGYCIEYDVPLTKQTRRMLYPVLYSRKISNNFTVKMYNTMIAEIKRNVFHNFMSSNTNFENVGSIYELFCIKDTDWSYQKEWRIIGGAKDHFKHLKIKAIYLGFKVCKTNEDKMIRYARKYKFALYKMNPPNGKKMIKYKRIVCGSTEESD